VTSPLAFRCTSCGHCCRALRVAITARDLLRLVRATDRSADELVEWLAPDSVDMTGEPESFVELSEGRRLMVLAQREQACLLLDASNRCRAYEARPRDCRAFPFDFERSPSATDAARESLKLLPLVGCDHTADGSHDLTALKTEDALRWNELERYQSLVARWNRGVFHRRRLGRVAGTASAFLSFALRETDAAP